MRFTENSEDYHHQHQDLRTEGGVDYGDTIAHVDFPYLAKVTATNAITAAAMASAPPPPTAVKIEGAVTADTKLSWNGSPGASVFGYRVHWRDTDAPMWNHERDAGKAESITLSNVPIDDFCVRCIERVGRRV